MDEKRNIYQRLHEAMMMVEYVQKEAKKAGMQYTFVSHDAVTAKVRPALLANGIVVIVTVKSYAQDGNRTEARMGVRFVNMDDPSDFIEVESFGYGIDSQDKGPGKAVSYGTKYALLKTLMLETGDDPERDNIEHETGEQKAWKARTAIIDIAAERSIALFGKDDEIGAYDEISGIANDDSDTEGKLYLWNKLKPHSGLRSAIKRFVDRDRKIKEMEVERG